MKNYKPTLNDMIEIIDGILNEMDVKLRERKLLIDITNDIIEDRYDITLPDEIINYIIETVFIKGDIDG